MGQKLLFVIGRGALITFLTLLISSLSSLAQLKVIAALTGNNGCLYQTVLFTIQNPPANATGYVTNFGDGATVSHSTANMQHIYSTAGVYVITTTISTPLGPLFAKSDSVYINNLPRVDFKTQNGNKFCNPAIVCIRDNSLPAIPLPGQPVTPITKSIFFFGDGAINIDLHVPPALRDFCYTHPSPDYRVYTYTLRLTDALGCVDTMRKVNYVYVAGDLGVKYSVNAPIGCNKTPTQFTTNATFTNQTRSEVVYPDSVKWFRWDFGDGSSDSTNWFTVQHTYTTNGIFSPRLIVETKMGCRDTFVLTNSVKNIKFGFDVSHSINKGSFNNVCWNQTPVPNSTKTWSFYTIPNPVFNPSTGTYTYGSWQPLSPDPNIFTESQTFTPCRSIPCGLARANLRVTVAGCKDTTWLWDTVEVIGPDALIEVPGNNATAIADSMRYQCKVINKVYFPNNSCHYKAFHVERLWDFGDRYARQCTTDTKNGINVFGDDTLSLRDPGTYPQGNNRPCNCNFSKDSLPSHMYTDWDTLALRLVGGSTFILSAQPPYSTKNFPCYTAKLMLYDAVNKTGDTDVVQLPFGPPKSGPDGTVITSSGHTRVVMPNSNYTDPVMLRKNGYLNCFGSAPNGIIFDLSGLQPACTRSWVSINYDSAAGLQPTKWVNQPSHFGKLNNQNPWSVPTAPKVWPNILMHNYFDPPGIADTTGYVTIGLVTGNGYGDKMCYDTAYYHKFIRIPPFSPVWDLISPIHDCVPSTVKGSLRKNYQDSITAIFWNWQDGWVEIDSIMRPYSKPNQSSYQRFHYTINPLGQVVNIKDNSSIPDTAVGLDTLTHKYTRAGRYFPSVTLITTQGCSEFHFKELVAGMYTDFEINDTVVCINDTVRLRDSVYYWIYPEPIFPPKEIYFVGRDPYLGGYRKTAPLPPYQFETLAWRILRKDSSTGLLNLVQQLTGALPVITFNTPGLYAVEFIVTDSTGCKDTTRKWISVIALKAGITIPKPLFSCMDTVHLFDNSSVIDPYFQAFGVKTDSIKPVNQNGYYWEFGDNKTPSPLKDPVHDYIPGSYLVYHHVKSVNGCEAQTSDSVRIHGPRAYFELIDSIGIAPFKAVFDNKSNEVVNNSKSFTWYFGNPNDPFNFYTTGSDSNMTKIYTQPGTYCVYLVAKDKPVGQPNFCPLIVYPDSFTSGIKKCVVVLPNPSGIASAKNTNGLLLYPNPAYETLTLYSQEEIKTLNVKVIDMMGRMFKVPVKKAGTSEWIISLESLAPGAYVLQAEQANSTSHLKFIRN